MIRSGKADLPLHYGKVPSWLYERMRSLGRAIVEVILIEQGKKEVLRRLSDPRWFQALGCVLGMDWHSSGITTSVLGALKSALNPISGDTGLYFCGGRGKHSRKTPDELLRIGDRTGLNGLELAGKSRLTAKVDNTAIQDGYQLYLHTFILSTEGDWTVIQQGMNTDTRYARRYHWHSERIKSFVEQPHTAICGKPGERILNLTDKKARSTREGILAIAKEDPLRMIREITTVKMPGHHPVKTEDVDLKRLGSVLALAWEKNHKNFDSLLLTPGLGPRTMQSLALVSEIIYGTPSRFKDPARFSFAHGGKDGYPFPVPTRVYDETIDSMEKTVSKAKIGMTDRKRALKDLHGMALNIENNFIPKNDLSPVMDYEIKNSKVWGGRTVYDDKKPVRHNKTGQLSLF